MSGLKVYTNRLSQPSRALLIFLRANKIQHEEKNVDLAKGEHFTEEYRKNVHRFGKVPAVDDNGVKLIETISILRYLCRNYPVAEHWYPKDSLKQAKVDEFLEWQHIACRSPLSMYFRTKFLNPIASGKPPKEEHVASWQARMEDALAEVENIWLADTPYLAGDTLTLADVIGACEIEQPKLAGYDPRDGRPKITAWLDRVSKDLSPHYEEIHLFLNKVSKKYKGVPPTSFAKL